ncbi:MAG: hypothetical protein HZB39_07895 [Planctomycetes bacterium]|nr:hypothetical protein [Planctomycetota bacterium]
MTSRSLAIPGIAAIALLGAAIPLAWPASSYAAVCAAETPGNPVPATPIDPLDQIRTTDVMAPLAEDLPLRLALGGSFDDLKPGTHQRLFFATHRHYEGPISEAAVQRLLDAGRADTLEHRLAPEALEALRREMAEYDEALRDFALLIVAEEQDVKRQLRQRPERCFEIRMQPREADPEYIRFLRERPAAKDGTVWGDPLKPAGERQIIVLWSDWPGLRMLYDDRTAMIVDRRRRVARWIEGRVRSEGVKIFSE